MSDASKGGRKRAEKLSADERRAIARRGADARWSGVKKFTIALALDDQESLAKLRDAHGFESDEAVFRALLRGHVKTCEKCKVLVA